MVIGRAERRDRAVIKSGKGNQGTVYGTRRGRAIGLCRLVTKRCDSDWVWMRMEMHSDGQTLCWITLQRGIN